MRVIKGKKSAPGTGIDCPAAHWRGPHWSRSLHCSLWRDTMLRTGKYALKEAAQTDRHLWPVRGATPNHSVLEGSTPWKGSTLQLFLRTAVHWKQIIWTDNSQTAASSHGRDPTLEQGNSAGRKEQWRVWWTDFEPDIPYHPCTIHGSRGTRVRNEGADVESVKKWKIGKMFLFLMMPLKVAVNLP